MTAAELLLVAKTYAAETGITLSTVSLRVTGTNNKLFRRLEAGLGVSSNSLETAADWFAENWPSDVPWPRGIPDPRHARAVAR